MPATSFIEIYIDQGQDWNSTITLTDDNTNATINAAGYQVAGTLKRNYYSKNASANFTVSFTDNANGVISIGLSSNVTANLKEGQYVFDVKSINPSNEHETLLGGLLIVSPSVTVL